MTYTTRNLETFDLLFKNFFNSDSFFAPVVEAKITHPVDIYEDTKGLHLEIAGTGLAKDDIDIQIEGDILRVIYEKPDEGSEPKTKFIHRGIARRSFNLGYKIASKFSLQNAEAEMKNGLLKICVPFAEEAKPKTLKIK
jgi:HSP20 family molecular chaperone IbpA